MNTQKVKAFLSQKNVKIVSVVPSSSSKQCHHTTQPPQLPSISQQQQKKKSLFIFPTSSSTSSSTNSPHQPVINLATQPLNFIPERKIIPKELYNVPSSSNSTTTTTASPSSQITEPPKKKIRFNFDRDISLFKEVTSCGTFLQKKGTPARRETWDKVAENMAKLYPQDGEYKNKTVRERVTNEMKEHRKKNSAELKGSGIAPEYNERDNLLDGLISMEDDYLHEREEENNNQAKKKKEKEENGKEQRNRCFERFSETEKRLKKEKKPRQQRSDKKKFDSKEMMDFVKQKWDNDKLVKEKDQSLLEREIALKEEEHERTNLLIASLKETIQTQKALIERQNEHIKLLLKEKES
eukprot:TCONS_00059449-protein